MGAADSLRTPRSVRVCRSVTVPLFFMLYHVACGACTEHTLSTLGPGQRNFTSYLDDALDMMDPHAHRRHQTSRRSRGSSPSPGSDPSSGGSSLASNSCSSPGSRYSTFLLPSTLRLRSCRRRLSGRTGHGGIVGGRGLARKPATRLEARVRAWRGGYSLGSRVEVQAGVLAIAVIRVLLLGRH